MFNSLWLSLCYWYILNLWLDDFSLTFSFYLFHHDSLSYVLLCCVDKRSHRHCCYMKMLNDLNLWYFMWKRRWSFSSYQNNSWNFFIYGNLITTFTLLYGTIIFVLLWRYMYNCLIKKDTMIVWKFVLIKYQQRRKSYRKRNVRYLRVSYDNNLFRSFYFYTISSLIIVRQSKV